MLLQSDTLVSWLWGPIGSMITLLHRFIQNMKAMLSVITIIVSFLINGRKCKHTLQTAQRSKRFMCNSVSEEDHLP